MNATQRRCGALVAPVLAMFALVAAAPGAVLEDFQFNDAGGTVLTEAANSANLGNNWLSQNTAIDAGVQDGSFRIQKGGEDPSVTGQVGNTLDIANITSGRAWLVVEIAGWNYTGTPSDPLERVRFGFLQNDPPAANSSIVTAEATIDRSGDGLALNGDALGFGGTDPGSSYLLPLVQTDPFVIALELDKDADTYSVYYQDGNSPWGSLGTGILGDVDSGSATGMIRDGNSIRFAFTGTFSDTDEFFDVERIYLTDTNPVPEPGALLLAGLAGAMWWAARRRHVMFLHGLVWQA